MDEKSDELWGFIARCAYSGLVCYAVVFALAFLRDVLRKSRLIIKLTATRGNPYSPLRWHSQYLKRYRDTNVFYWVELFRFLLNGTICILYIIGTYRREVPVFIKVINRVAAAFFIADLSSILWSADSALARVFTLLVMSEAFSIPSLLIADGPNSYLNFAFLRSIQTYAAFSRLERRLFVQFFSSKRLIGKLSFQCLTLFYALAAGIQLLEIPGDLLTSDFRDTWDAFGDWNFFNSIYFVIVTLSTVGYGDFSPSTIQGRLYTILIIIIGIVIFTTVIGELVEHSSRGRGSGSFNKNPDTRHVIITGTPTLADLTLFVSEFYTDSRDSNADAKIVVLIENPTWTDPDWFKYIARNQFLQARIEFLVGSVRNPVDMQRARVQSADAVFFLTSPSVGEEPSVEDMNTIMNILSVRNVRTDIPIYAQTLLEESSMQAVVALTTPTSYTKGTYARNTKLMRQSASYHGLFHQVLKTEFGDLPRAHRRHERLEFEEVLRFYNEFHEQDERFGVESSISDLDRSQLVCLQEMHMALMSSNMRVNGVATLLSNIYLDVQVGKPAPDDPAWLAEYHMGAKCSMVYAIVPEHLDGVLIRNIALELFHLGLVLVATSNPKHVQMYPILTTETVLRRGDIAMFLTYHEQSCVGAAIHLVAERCKSNAMRHPLPGTSQDCISPDMSLGVVEVNNTPSVGKNNAYQRYVLPFRLRLSTSEDALGGDGSNRPGKDRKINYEVPENIAGHVIVAMDGDTPMSNLSLFLKGLWSQNVRKSGKKSREVQVVVISPNVEGWDHDLVGQHAGISLFFVPGTSSSADSWEKARLGQAKSVATMADYTQPWHVSDARTIFALLTLEVGTASDHDIYICSELVHEKSLELLREPIHPRRRGALLGDQQLSPVPSVRSGASSPLHTDVRDLGKEGSSKGQYDDLAQAGKTITFRDEPEEIPPANMEDCNKQNTDKGVEADSPSPSGSPDAVKESLVTPSVLGGSSLLAPLKSFNPLKSFKTSNSKASMKSVEFTEFQSNPMAKMVAEAGTKSDIIPDPTEVAGAARARRGSLFSRSRYASGELLIHSSAMTLLAREYTEPGFARFYGNLLGTDPSSPGLKIRLVRIPKDIFNEKYGAIQRSNQLLVPFRIVFRSLIRQGVTPLGLYRSGTAPVLIPTKSRKRRGITILEQLEPYFEKHSPKVTSAPKLGNFLGRLWTAATDLTPSRMQEQKGLNEVTGAAVQGSDTDSDDDDQTAHGNGLPPNAPSPQKADVPGLDLEQDDKKTGAEHETRREGDDGGRPSASAALRSDVFARLLGNNDESLEVPGETKYRERPVTNNMLPYVYTLPDPNTLCAASDGVYILCNSSFALSSKWAEELSHVSDSD